MKPFDVMTWASIVILVVGSSLIFIWFLKDAGSVLRGSDEDSEPHQDEEASDRHPSHEKE